MNHQSTKSENMSWKYISGKKVFENPRLTIFEDQVELPSGHKTSYLRFGSGWKSVTVICIRDGNILLQQEYSYPPNEVLYQFPGGKVESNETIFEAAKRELAEESGLNAVNIYELGWYYQNNRRSDAKMHVVIAENFTPATNPSQGDMEENIKSEWISLSQFESMLRSGQIVNFSVLAAWALFNSHSSMTVEASSGNGIQP